MVQQAAEGDVLAPGDGRVLTVPVTRGAVILAGEPVATIGGGGFFLRLAIPERHAAALRGGRGDPHHRRRRANPTGGWPRSIRRSRTAASSPMSRSTSLETAFVDARVLVEVPVGEREALLVPAAAVATRSGIDFVTVERRRRRGRARAVVLGEALSMTAKPASRS